MNLESIAKNKVYDSLYLFMMNKLLYTFYHINASLWQGNEEFSNRFNSICIFQCRVKREIETEEKSSHLVDSENDMSCDIKVEIDNAEEESVDNGELVRYLYSFYIESSYFT